MFVSVSEIKHQSSLSSSCLCVFFTSSSRNKKKKSKNVNEVFMCETVC